MAGVDEVERRVRGGDVRWSRDWNDSFDDAVMERVEALLGGRPGVIGDEA
jgi:hypothetical protein